LDNKLAASQEKVVKHLDADAAKSMDIAKIDVNEVSFRWMMNENPMATGKLAEGIRNFAKDIVKLEEIIKQKM
jgi:transaldolase